MRSGETTLFGGVILPVFYTVDARTYTVLPPPRHYCGGRCCTFLYGWLRDASLCYPQPRLNAAVFGAMTVSVLSDSSLCFHPYTTPRLNAACFGAMSVSVLSNSYTPYTTPRVNAACFGAMSVSMLGDPSLCYPPTLHPG